MQLAGSLEGRPSETRRVLAPRWVRHATSLSSLYLRIGIMPLTLQAEAVASKVLPGHREGPPAQNPASDEGWERILWGGHHPLL